MAPQQRLVESGFYFVLIGRAVKRSCWDGETAAVRIYTQPVIRSVDPEALAVLSDDAADRGEEDGLEGNQLYCDLRGIAWEQVSDALLQEAAFIARLTTASDLDAEGALIEAEREEADFPDDDLWGLDVGVIGATLALSALGATPVSSCNAGGFGGHHVAAFPHVAFFLPRAVAAEVLAIAEAADVGLDVVEGGIARLYGRTDFDLHRFAQVALNRHDATL